jgi:hypothetical protein
MPPLDHMIFRFEFFNMVGSHNETNSIFYRLAEVNALEVHCIYGQSSYILQGYCLAHGFILPRPHL